MNKEQNTIKAIEEIKGACAICLEVTHASELVAMVTTLGKKDVCGICSTDKTFVCGICGEVHYKSGAIGIEPVPGGELGEICPKCDALRREHLGENEYICSICGEIHRLNDEEHTWYDDGDKIACYDCTNKYLVECRDCNTWHHKNDATFLDYLGEYICDDCKDNYEECEQCGELFPANEMEKDGNKHYCSDCYDEDYQRCECCGHIVSRDYTYYHEKTDTLYCDDCWEANSFTCDTCSETHHNDESHSVRDIYDNEVLVCSDCYENFHECSECGEEYHYDNMEWDEEDGCHYCTDCASKRDAIHDYSYKPEPVFYGGCESESGKMFYGVEIEVDNGGEDNSNAREILSNLGGFAYAKHDGSLSRGFEIVSHPATLDYHRGADFKDAFKCAVSKGYKAHQTDTCGLHVHVGRNGLGDSYEERELTIMKVLYIVEKHWETMVKFSRRRNSELGEWASRYLEYQSDRSECLDSTYEGAKKLHDRAKGGNRYKAINLNNDNTIEFRLFKGTLKYNSFIATLQFVDVLCNIAKESSVQRIVALTWDDILEASKGYSELMQYYIERRLLTYADSEGEEI